MKFVAASLIASAAALSSIETVITQTVNGVETVYTTVCPLTETVITTTVEGVETFYTTVCPLTETPATEEAVPATSAPVESETDSDIYVYETTTPVVEVSTGVEATVTMQSSFTSVYNSTVSSISTYEGGADRNVVGVAGILGAALLML